MRKSSDSSSTSPPPHVDVRPRDFAFLEVNIAAVEKYGYTREEFLTMTLRDIRPPEIETGSLDIEAKWRLELQHATEWRHRLKSGRSIDVEISSHTLAYQGRKAAFVIVQEITERKGQTETHTGQRNTPPIAVRKHAGRIRLLQDDI
jgi:PAS domain S-box-containing protein